MPLRPTNRDAETDRSSLGNDRTPTYSNVTRAPSHTLAGRDSETPPDRTESSLTDTIGVTEKSKVATTNYSKRPSVSPPTPILIRMNFVSILSDLH